MHSETKRDIVTFFGCIICCVSLGSSFIIPVLMRKPLSFEEETGISSDNVETLPVGDISFNNTDSLGWELLDNGSVIHAWNNRDNYYFNNSNGIQFSNHYEEYWSKNVLMLGYYNNDEWNLIYRTDELSGFNKDFDGETDSFMNLTLWKDLSHGGYDFRLAIRYHLGVNDSDLTVIPYIKNLGIAIPYTLGFGWELKDIQVANTIINDHIRINDTSYLLNQSLDQKYTNISHQYTHTVMVMDEEGNWTGNYTTKNQTVYNTRFTLFDDTKSIREVLYIRWNHTLDYLVWVKSRDGQVNAPVTLFIKIGTLDVGQEKFTLLGWYDATGDYPEINGWEYAVSADGLTVVVNKPSGTVENDLLVAFVAADGVEDIYSPSGWTGIASVESDACSLASYYKVATSSEPSDYTFTWGTSEDCVGSIIRITGANTATPIHVNTTAFESGTGQPLIAPDITTSVDNCVILRGHVIDDNDEGDDYDGYPTGHIGLFAKTDVTCSHSVAYENLSGQGSAGTAQWTFENNEEFVAFSIAVAPASATLPSQSGESPVNGSTGVAVLSSLYVVCSDINNDTMRAIWRSNSSGSWVTFASNTSITSGTNISQTNVNFSLGSENYSWIVCLTDDYSDTSWTNNTYWLNTALAIPEIQVISPVNGSTGISTSPTVQIKPWDNGTFAEDMTVKWYENSSVLKNIGTTSEYDIADGWNMAQWQTGTKHEGIAGNVITMTDTGHIKNITARVRRVDANDEAKCAIYWTSNSTLIDVTEEKLVTDTSYTWYDFEFSTPVTVTSGVGYAIEIYGDAPDADPGDQVFVELDYASSVGDSKHQNSVNNYPTFPSPATFSDDVYDFCIYATFSDVYDWSLQETDNDVSSGSTASWTYTNASESSTEYWWRVVVNNSEQTNGSVDWYSFTTEAGEVGEEWNINITGYLTGGNDTLDWDVSTIGYLVGGNDTLDWIVSVPGYLIGGSEVVFNTVDTGYLSGGNDSSWDTSITGYLIGGNDTLDWSINVPGWLTGGNDTLGWTVDLTGYLTGGNESSIAVWNLSKTGYLTGGNDTLDWDVSTTGYLIGGNDTLSWTVYLTGWLSGGNDTVTIVYVDDDFDSGTSGWGTTHFDTIQNATNNVTTGGTVYIWAGTYNETVITSKSLDYIGNSSSTVIVNGSETGTGFTISSNWTNFSDIQIKNFNRGAYLDYRENITFDRCNFTSNDGSTARGLYANLNCINITIINSTFFENDDAIYFNNDWSRDIIIKNCTIENNNGYGIWIEWSNYSNISNCEIINNGDADNTPGVWLYDCHHYEIYNCNITGNDDGNVILDNENTYCNFTNCNISGSPSYAGVTVRNTGHNATFENCTISDNDEYWGNVYLDGGADWTYLLNCTINGTDYGIYIADSDNNTISGCNITNADYGIYIDTDGVDNLIYNNWFDNDVNAFDDSGNAQSWNITKTSGTNIYGGSYLGGNYWHNYTGVDTDGDGLGNTDVPWTDNGNISTGGDNLPLTIEAGAIAIWNLSKTAWLSGGNDTLIWALDIPGYLIGGNDTLAWSIDIPGWLSGGNDTLDWSISISGWLDGGNESVTTVWNLSKTGYLLGGNDTLDWSISIPGWLIGGNDTISWAVDLTGYLIGGSEVEFNTVDTGWLTGGNETSWALSIPGYLTGGNDTLTWSNSVTGWLSGGNETIATIWNLSKTGYLTGGNDTYLSCSFTYTVKGSIVTTTPTITEAIRYKWVIEDNAETEWIPIADIHNYQVMLPDNGNYKITLIAEDAITSVSFMQIVIIKISVADDKKEPEPVEKPKKPRVRNIFEDTGMADWFENRNIGELVFIGIIGICAFVMLFRRRPKKLLVYPTLKKR